MEEANSALNSTGMLHSFRLRSVRPVQPIHARQVCVSFLTFIACG